MELIRGNYKVELTYEGEGWFGDYDSSDPEDEPLLRFYVSRLNDDGEWEALPDASYCTALQDTISEEYQQQVLELLLEAAEDGVSRRQWEELSWLGIDAFSQS